MTEWRGEEIDRPYHPAALMFPLLEGQEFEDLKADIQANGLLEAIWLHPDGSILDGRNRHRACLDLGLEPKFRVWTDNGAPFSFVVSMNLKRRHLTYDQRVGLALKLEPALAEEARQRQATSGPGVYGGKPLLPNSAKAVHAAEEAAKQVGVGKSAVVEMKAAQAEQPGLADDLIAGKTTVRKERKRNKARVKERASQVAKAKVAQMPAVEVCDMRICSCADLFASGIHPDIVITDPPYPKEFLHLYGELAQLCAVANVPVVAAMCGQSYLPEVLELMCQHLTYRWTIAYLTPGGQAVQQFPRKVNAFWKPVLVFGEAMEWFGDVAQSKVNDNDKRFHDWGQSESGMLNLVQRLAKPGQLVCDPFMGAGTTALAVLAAGSRFVGCDINTECIAKAKVRVQCQREV